MRHEHDPMIIAIDGPAGSGKSSVCAKVAARLGFLYLNTGYLYRAIGLLAREAGLELVDSPALNQLVMSFVEGASWQHQSATLWYGERNLTPLLDTVSAGNDASLVAKNPEVRRLLIPLQRRLTQTAPHGALVDGRDIGTVVFPDARLKIFLTASLQERARRRMAQLIANGKSPVDSNSAELLAVLEADIARRDAQDAGRGIAPLKQAEDAMLFDTSGLSVEAVIEELVALIKAQQR